MSHTITVDSGEHELPADVTRDLARIVRDIVLEPLLAPLAGGPLNTGGIASFIEAGILTTINTPARLAGPHLHVNDIILFHTDSGTPARRFELTLTAGGLLADTPLDTSIDLDIVIEGAGADSTPLDTGTITVDIDSDTLPTSPSQ